MTGYDFHPEARFDLDGIREFIGADNLDADVLKWLKAHGRGYQTRIDRILRAGYGKPASAQITFSAGIEEEHPIRRRTETGRDVPKWVLCGTQTSCRRLAFSGPEIFGGIYPCRRVRRIGKASILVEPIPL